LCENNFCYLIDLVFFVECVTRDCKDVPFSLWVEKFAQPCNALSKLWIVS